MMSKLVGAMRGLLVESVAERFCWAVLVELVLVQCLGGSLGLQWIEMTWSHSALLD
jgi:uncharacterized membrane protein